MTQPDFWTDADLFATSDDICSNKHKGNESSELAMPSKEAKANDRRIILNMLRERDMTSKIICAKMGKPLHCVTPRISELKRDGLVRETGERSEGCAILKAV